jgi:hypothetical protein
LNPDTITTEQNEMTDSPDLGSPPVARFDLNESTNGPELLSVASPDEEEELPQDLNINIETRRKRKDSGKRLMVFSASPESSDTERAADEDLSRLSKKRKMSDRLPERNEENSESSFLFSLKSSIKGESTSLDSERKALSDSRLTII